MPMVQAPEFEPEDQTKCGVKKSQSRPLIVEWPAADRGALEAQKNKGLVAVRYMGCEMEVLRQCAVSGGYGYVPVTPKEDRIRIATEDELYANIPVFAAKFESKLASAGRLDVEMTIVGSYEADQHQVKASALSGDCDRATHFISAITAGAFEFSAGGSAEIGGGADVMGAGAGAESLASRELLNRDGYKKACLEATNDDTMPPEGCGALLRVEVVPIDRRAEAPVDVVGTLPSTPPARAAVPEVGPGVVKMHIDSDEPVQLVRLGALGALPPGINMSGVDPMFLRPRELVCTSPCDEWVDGRAGAEFLLTGTGVMETEPFQLQPRQGEHTMTVDTGSASAHYWGVYSTLVGGSFVLSGGLVMGLGVGLSSSSSGGSGDSMRNIMLGLGGGFAGLGVVLMAIGIPLWVTSDTEYDVREAAVSSEDLLPVVGSDGSLTWHF